MVVAKALSSDKYKQLNGEMATARRDLQQRETTVDNKVAIGENGCGEKEVMAWRISARESRKKKKK